MPNLLISKWEVLGDREAIISGEKRITFSLLKDRVFRLANGLQGLGLKPKDKFAELLYNGNEFFEAFFAGCFIGCPMPFYELAHERKRIGRGDQQGHSESY